ncbi:hypothetical protein, partial [Burkholderia sp. E168m23]|uniref:hypothetical protein n=1 Tax=Burkholderia sp. E168m23 TaxID=1561200 RepID=UPI001F2DED6E
PWAAASTSAGTYLSCMVWFGLGFKRRDGSRAGLDRKSCWPGGAAGSLWRDLFGVSGYFPGCLENAGLPGKKPASREKQ